MDCKQCPFILFMLSVAYNDKWQIDQIKKEVAALFSISPKDLSLPTRKKHISQARRLAIIRCVDETGATYEMIGKAFNRSHATVIVKLEVFLSDTWGGDCSLDQVFEQASSAAKIQIENLVSKNRNHIQIKELTATGFIVKKERL